LALLSVLLLCLNAGKSEPWPPVANSPEVNVVGGNYYAGLDIRGRNSGRMGYRLPRALLASELRNSAQLG
jgi:hypothetical protein